MRVKLTSDFEAALPHEIYPRVYPGGEIVEGALAEMALAAGAGDRIDEESPAPPAPAKRKAK